MAQLTLTRPAADESAAWYHGYIASVPADEVGSWLVSQIDELEHLVRSLDDRAALGRYAEGKWSIKEVVGHLIDAERVFAYRLLRLSRGDATPMPGFDENAYVEAARFDARPLGDLIAELRLARINTRAVIEHVQPERWTFRGQANGQPITPRALVYIIVGHVAHHVAVLQTRYGLGAGAS